MFLQQDQHCHQTCLKLLLDTGQTDNNNDINDLQRTVRVIKASKKGCLKKTNTFCLILLMEEIMHHLGCVKPCK